MWCVGGSDGGGGGAAAATRTTESMLSSPRTHYDFDSSSPPSISSFPEEQQQPAQQSSSSFLTDSLQRPWSTLQQQLQPLSVSEWFRYIVFWRTLTAIAIHALYCCVVYFVGACILQLSLLHPIKTIQDCFSLLLSLRSAFHALVFAMFGAIYSAFFGFLVLRFDTEDRFSYRSLWAWLIYFASLNIALSQVFCLSVGSKLSNSSGFFIHLLVVAHAVACFYNIFLTNHRLIFPIIEMRPYMQLDFVVIPAINEIMDRKLQRILKWTIICSLICGIPVFGWSLFRNLFTVSAYFNVLVLLVVQLFLHQIAISLIKVFVLQSYEFPMPPPYAVLHMKPEEQRTLMDALASTGIAKVFAFFDLRTLSATCHRRRQIIFSLSQPGGHPRNWDVVRVACLQQIQFLNQQFENENSRIRTETFASVSSTLVSQQLFADTEGDHRPAILLQSSWPRDNIRQRITARDLRKPGTAKNALSTSFVNKLPLFMDKLKAVFIHGDHRIVSAYDLYIGILAIESLSSLICVSLNEDRFGVVQKDLHSIVSTLLHFCNNLQKYMRIVKADKEWQKKACIPLLIAITITLNRMRLTFPEGVISRRLNAQEALYFEKLTSAD